MVTATNTLINSQTGSVDFSSKTVKTDNFSDKVTSGVYKTDNKKTYEKSKSEDFKEVLNSKSNYKDDNAQKVNNNNDKNKTEDISKVDELKEKLKELEKDSDKVDSKEKAEDILSQLLALLNKLGVKEEDLKSNGEINSENLKNLIEALNEKNSSKNNVDNILQKLVDLMKNDSVKDSLDTDSLKSIKDILSKLSANLVDDNTKATKDIKSGIKNLMSEVSNVLESKQNQNTKVLTLEDMLNNKSSQDKKDGSLGDESGKNTASEAGKTNKEASKEDKFLNSLLDDNKDNSMNKINLFASRSQVIQNQNGDTVRGLTINKATFANDLIKDVKFMSTSAMKELTVKVNPGDIGEITIKLIQEDGVMKANLKANSKEATALLAQNLSDIKKQLNEQNIKIADVNIELYQDDTTFFSEQGFGGQLSEEQRRSNSNSNSGTGNYSTAIEEEISDNVVSGNSNLEVFA
jgi:flagellar hook-length control protein FliK